MTNNRSATDEVARLHRFFDDWYDGRGDDPEDFVRFEEALAPGFRLITPEGSVLDREAVIGGVRSGRGHPARIWIERARQVWAAEALTLVEYEEWQERSGVVRGRLSSALLDASGGGWVWLHVHETWLAGDSS